MSRAQRNPSNRVRAAKRGVSQGLNPSYEGGMVDQSEKYRSFYARLICAAARADDPRIEQAFRAVMREPFAGPGPWSIGLGGHPYVETPDDDPAFLYQIALLALDRERGINIGIPNLSPQWAANRRLGAGGAVLPVGAGSDYYTSILAHLVGER